MTKTTSDSLVLWCPACGLTWPLDRGVVLNSMTWKNDEWPTGVLRADCPRCLDRLLLTLWILEDGVLVA